MEKLQNGEAGGASLPRAEGDVRGLGEDDKMLSTGQTVQVRNKQNYKFHKIVLCFQNICGDLQFQWIGLSDYKPHSQLYPLKTT